MRLVVTLSGDVGKYLIRGAIWERGAYSYRANVHLVPSAPRLALSEAIVLVSVNGPSLQGVLDAATARVMTAIGEPVQNLQVVSRGGRPQWPSLGVESAR
jgi:hypothetical protein